MERGEGKIFMYTQFYEIERKSLTLARKTSMNLDPP